MAQKRILFVDDDSIWREFAEILLGEFELFFAENGKEALDKIKEDSFDLIITDTEMPVMNGKELIIYLKAHFPEMSIIMISSLDHYKNWADGQGICFISKEFFISLLPMEVKKILN